MTLEELINEKVKQFINEKEERFINEKEVSIITGRAIQTLRNDRFNRKGIPYIKIGRSVRYKLKDVFCFMDSCKVDFDSSK